MVDDFIGVVIARVRDAELPGKPNLLIKEEKLWQRAVRKLKEAGASQVLVGSDSEDIPGIPLGGVLGLGGGTDAQCVKATVNGACLTPEGFWATVTDSTPIAILDVGASLASPQDIAEAVDTCKRNPPIQGVVAASIFHPVHLTNFRKGQRVMYHISKTRLNKKGTVLNGSFYVLKWGWLKESNSLIPDKGFISIVSKDRGLVISDALDYLSAKAWEGAN